MNEFVKRRKAQEDELKEKIKAGAADEPAWDHLQLPVIPYVSITLEPASVPG